MNVCFAITNAKYCTCRLSLLIQLVIVYLTKLGIDGFDFNCGILPEFVNNLTTGMVV